MIIKEANAEVERPTNVYDMCRGGSEALRLAFYPEWLDWGGLMVGC